MPDGHPYYLCPGCDRLGEFHPGRELCMNCLPNSCDDCGEPFSVPADDYRCEACAATLARRALSR